MLKWGPNISPTMKQHRNSNRTPAQGVSPAFINKADAAYVLGSLVLLKRAMFARRLRIIRQGGRGSSTLIDYPSVLDLVEFIRGGGELPLLPSEIRNS